jgi:flagellar basal body-associated protein FliL
MISRSWRIVLLVLIVLATIAIGADGQVKGQTSTSEPPQIQEPESGDYPSGDTPVVEQSGQNQQTGQETDSPVVEQTGQNQQSGQETEAPGQETEAPGQETEAPGQTPEQSPEEPADTPTTTPCTKNPTEAPGQETQTPGQEPEVPVVPGSTPEPTEVKTESDGGGDHESKHGLGFWWIIIILIILTCIGCCIWNFIIVKRRESYQQIPSHVPAHQQSQPRPVSQRPTQQTQQQQADYGQQQQQDYGQQTED